MIRENMWYTAVIFCFTLALVGCAVGEHTDRVSQFSVEQSLRNHMVWLSQQLHDLRNQVSSDYICKADYNRVVGKYNCAIDEILALQAKITRLEARACCTRCCKEALK